MKFRDEEVSRLGRWAHKFGDPVQAKIFPFKYLENLGNGRYVY